MRDYVPTVDEPTKRWLRFAGVLVGGMLVVWMAIGLSDVLTPIAAALAAAYVLNPVVRWLESRGSTSRSGSNSSRACF